MEKANNTIATNVKIGGERIIYYDFLRIIAMTAVIALHVSANNWSSVDVHTLQWNAFNFYEGIVRWGVPVFTMISGALFLDNRKELNVKTLYSKNILRLVIAFLFWSTIYAIVANSISSMSTARFISRVIQGNYHMWFIYMIVGLYILTPFLRKITENKKVTGYFLIVTFMFTFFIPAAFEILKVIDVALNTGGRLV